MKPDIDLFDTWIAHTSLFTIKNSLFNRFFGLDVHEPNNNQNNRSLGATRVILLSKSSNKYIKHRLNLKTAVPDRRKEKTIDQLPAKI